MVPSACVHHLLLLFFGLLSVLHVSAQIAWLTKPRHTAVALGQDLVLDCRAHSQGPQQGHLTYTWLFNQSSVQAKALPMANSSLFVPHITQQDEGEYTCVVRLIQAEEQVDEMESSALVVIAYIEDFVLQPENTTALIGSEAVLTCVTGRSVPYPMVHWEMNNVRMENAKSVTASYGDFDRTGLSAQISMKLIYMVVDENPRSFRCVAENPLSGETVRSHEATVIPETVDVTPQILSTFPAQMLVTEFQRVTLLCEVIGYPKPYVSWNKDGSYLDDPEVYIRPDRAMVIVSAEEEDAGMYSCEADNRAGKVVSNKTEIIVATIGLEFVTEPSDTTVLAGNPVTLHCTPPHSVPPAAVTWYKDYVPFTHRTGVFAASVIQSGAARNLHFSSVQKSDEGEYYCVASNNYSLPNSRTSKIARLTVKGAPVITEPPINTKVVKGTLLHLSCRVTLATVRSVFWTFNGERLQSSPTVSITNHGQDLWVNDVGKSWEGWYICTAENSYGEKTASALVTVVVPPVTLQELGFRTVTVNYAILLPCFIYGDPQPTIVWYHNGVQVVDDVRHRLLSTGLYIDPVSTDDRGNYSCMGNNSAGLTWSNGTLDVMVPPTADVGDAQKTAVVGKPLTLKCHVQGHPLPSIHWLHNSTSFVENGILLSDDNTSLSIPVFTWSLSGQYSCVAVNSEDTATSAVTVCTQVRPQVLEIMGKTSIDIGRTLNLTCRSEGVPTPHVHWRHEGRNMEATIDGRVSFPYSGGLLVKFVTKRDEGQYDCIASSIVGDSNRSIRVVIVEPPRPPQLLEAIAVSMNSVLLRWRHVFQAPSTDVEAFVIHYRKRVGGSMVDYPEKVSQVTTEKEVEGLEAGTEYVFTVSAENSAGQGEASNSLTALTFQSGPSEPKNLQLVSTTATTATVAWEIPSHTNGNIQHYQIQFRKNGEADYSVVSVTSGSSPSQRVMLETLIPHTNYSVRVRAANVWQGQTLWGLFSKDLSLLTNMTVPSAPPSDVRVSVLDPYSVLITWRPVPMVHQHGPITRYTLIYKLENEAASLGILTTDSSQLSIAIRGLSPWTWYSLTVEAENPKGFSPKSDAVRVRTNPAVPGAPPQSVTVSALPANTLHVDWQPVPAKSRNSQLARYIVQYRLTGEATWTELTTPDNETFTMSISNLSPWSWYEVRLAAETTQVSPGQGPFSAAIQIRTLQAAAGPVRSVSWNISTTTISLSWLPPLQPSGVLNGYRVDFHPIPWTESDKRVMVVNKTEAELSHLWPGLQYNISISALNGAGSGNTTIIRLHTAPAPVPVPSSTPQQEEKEEAETMLDVEEVTTAANQTSSASRQLPVIVAGSLTGAAILIIILIFLMCRCFRARRETRAKYLIHTGHEEGYGSGSSYRHMDNESDIIITTPQRLPSTSQPQSPSSSSVLYSQQQQQQQNRTPQELADSSWLSQQAQKAGERAEGPPVYLPVEGAGADVKVPVSLSPDGEVFTVLGVDNPGFTDDKLLLPGLSSSAVASTGASPAGVGEEGAEQVSTLNRRKGRMRSESAAAIAVLRSTTSAIDDTQFLLSNEFSNVDTEVVFKHRTVL